MSEQPGDDVDADGGSLDATTQRRAVRERFADIAATKSISSVYEGPDASDSAGCCGSSPAGDGTEGSEPAACCTAEDVPARSDEAYATNLGYSNDDIDAVPDGSNLNLGCGNPVAIVSLEPGQTVIDLGSGAGFDCFLAAREVGETGRVIGIDMTPEMVKRARELAGRSDAVNVEFRLGEIEHLPVTDETADVVMSNCVINLSPDKQRVYREAFRVLQPGGRLSVSDVVLTASVPSDLRGDPTAVASCVAGAAPVNEIESMLRAAGFVEAAVKLEADSAAIVREWDDERDLSAFVASAQITGQKPARDRIAADSAIDM